jgi:hypothetical protein
MPFAKVQRVKGSGQDVLGFSRVGLIPRGCCLEQKRKIPIVQRFSEGEPNLGAKNRRQMKKGRLAHSPGQAQQSLFWRIVVATRTSQWS